MALALAANYPKIAYWPCRLSARRAASGRRSAARGRLYALKFETQAVEHDFKRKGLPFRSLAARCTELDPAVGAAVWVTVPGIADGGPEVAMQVHVKVRVTLVLLRGGVL